MFKNIVNYIKLRFAMKETLELVNYAWVASNKKEYHYYVRRWHIINARLGNKYVMNCRHGYETFRDYLKAMES